MAHPHPPGEVQRILTYQDRGWVATPAELRQYLRWLWRCHPAHLVAAGNEEHVHRA